jgi:hypothetical protein
MLLCVEGSSERVLFWGATAWSEGSVEHILFKGVTTWGEDARGRFSFDFVPVFVRDLVRIVGEWSGSSYWFGSVRGEKADAKDVTGTLFSSSSLITWWVVTEHGDAAGKGIETGRLEETSVETSSALVFWPYTSESERGLWAELGGSFINRVGIEDSILITSSKKSGSASKSESESWVRSWDPTIVKAGQLDSNLITSSNHSGSESMSMSTQFVGGHDELVFEIGRLYAAAVNGSDLI